MFKQMTSFGVIVGTRGFLNPRLAEDGGTEIVKRLVFVYPRSPKGQGGSTVSERIHRVPSV